MNFVFAIYANDNYCELHLPALDNADYTMVLRASELGLMGDVQVQLDVMNQRWRIKPSTDYQLFCKGRMFEGEQLEHGQILQLITKEKEKLVLLVWRSGRIGSPSAKVRRTTSAVPPRRSCPIGTGRSVLRHRGRSSVT